MSWTRDGVLADPRGGVDTQRRPDGSRHLLKAVTAAWRHYAAVGNFLHLCLQVSIVSQTVYRTSGFRFRLPAASVSLKAITEILALVNQTYCQTFDISQNMVSYIIESL